MLQNQYMNEGETMIAIIFRAIIKTGLIFASIEACLPGKFVWFDDPEAREITQLLKDSRIENK